MGDCDHEGCPGGVSLTMVPGGLELRVVPCPSGPDATSVTLGGSNIARLVFALMRIQGGLAQGKTEAASIGEPRVRTVTADGAPQYLIFLGDTPVIAPGRAAAFAMLSALERALTTRDNAAAPRSN